MDITYYYKCIISKTLIQIYFIFIEREKDIILK